MFTKDQQRMNSFQVYATQAAMGRGVSMGIPAKAPNADDPEYVPVYEQLLKLLDGYASGFPRAKDITGQLAGIPEGAEIEFLKTYYYPEHAKIAIHIPIDRFAETAEIAQKTGLSEKEARENLLLMAERVNIFHKVENNVDLWRHIAAFPGQIAMSTRRLSTEFWAGMGPYMLGYQRPVEYDQEDFAWRWIPASADYVAKGELDPCDNVEKMLREARAVAVCACICRSPKPPTAACNRNEPPYEACLQLDDFADFYVNDLKISRYLDKDEIEKQIAYNKEHRLAITVSGSQKSEIICCCCPDCCGPFDYYKKYGMGGPQHWKATNYYIEKNQAKCTNCGECVKWCFSQQGQILVGGFAEHRPDRCVGCGICVQSCPNNALILRHKKPEECYTYPEDTFDLWVKQGKDRYGRGADHLPRLSMEKK